jgi:hypothetical protein
MAKKVNLNCYVEPSVADRFRETAAHYDGRIGDCLSAAMLLFLEATPQEQAEAMKRVYAASLTSNVKAMLDEIRAEQTRKALKDFDPKRRKGS